MGETFKAGERPRIRIKGRSAWQGGDAVLCRINSRTAYFRSRHVVGELAVAAEDVEFILHTDGTRVLETEQWPPPKPLTPYDTGERLEPKVWVVGGISGHEYPRLSEPDDYGRVDFDDDAGTTVATVYAKRVDGTFVLVVYSHETDSETAVNLMADLSIYRPNVGQEAATP